jgi:SAM-dependent methyltransferase
MRVPVLYPSALAGSVPLRKLVHRHRLLGKRLLSAANRVLPAWAASRLSAMAEQVAFRVVPAYQEDTLPPIFHHWSERCLRPRLAELGFDSPADFYYAAIRDHGAAHPGPVAVLSLGSGACAMELQLAERLRGEGLAAVIECVDFNAALMRQAEAQAATRGLDPWLRFTVRDCTKIASLEPKDVIIVNEFFHHIAELEGVCAQLRGLLQPEGTLVSFDVIGRNGHQLWPAVDEVVQRHWAALPAAQRHDGYFGRVTPRYLSVDHAAYSNEGVRAQDVVACLLREFDFELFLTYGAAVMPFVERRAGFNFSPDRAEDRALLDRIADEDAAALRARAYPASNMVLRLRHRGRVGATVFDPVSPQEHVALTATQQRLLESSRHG